jgi:2-keto-4-pentenoate hydratase
MLSEEVRQEIAKDIYRCFGDKTQIPLLNTTYPEIEVVDAYRIQEKVIASFLDAGRRIKGYKIGLTSKPMQEMAGTTEPDYSAMLDSMFYPEASQLARADWCSPLVEIEIAFVMKERLEGPGINVAEVIRAIRGSLLINGELREQGRSDAVLGNPLTAVAWLANKLSEFGVAFEPGDVILSGSFLRALPVQAGDDVVARFDPPFGDVLLSFN